MAKGESHGGRRSLGDDDDDGLTVGVGEKHASEFPIVSCCLRV